MKDALHKKLKPIADVQSIRGVDLPVGLEFRQLVVTGPPGAGKSSLVDAMITTYRSAGCRVGVVAVDPEGRITTTGEIGDRGAVERCAAGDIQGVGRQIGVTCVCIKRDPSALISRLTADRGQHR